MHTNIYAFHVEQTRLQTYIMCTFDIFQQENMNHPIFILSIVTRSILPLLIFHSMNRTMLENVVTALRR